MIRFLKFFIIVLAFALNILPQKSKANDNFFEKTDPDEEFEDIQKRNALEDFLQKRKSNLNQSSGEKNEKSKNQANNLISIGDSDQESDNIKNLQEILKNLSPEKKNESFNSLKEDKILDSQPEIPLKPLNEINQEKKSESFIDRLKNESKDENLNNDLSKLPEMIPEEKKISEEMKLPKINKEEEKEILKEEIKLPELKLPLKNEIQERKEEVKENLKPFEEKIEEKKEDEKKLLKLPEITKPLTPETIKPEEKENKLPELKLPLKNEIQERKEEIKENLKPFEEKIEEKKEDEKKLLKLPEIVKPLTPKIIKPEEKKDQLEKPEIKIEEQKIPQENKLQELKLPQDNVLNNALKQDENKLKIPEIKPEKKQLELKKQESLKEAKPPILDLKTVENKKLEEKKEIKEKKPEIQKPEEKKDEKIDELKKINGSQMSKIDSGNNQEKIKHVNLEKNKTDDLEIDCFCEDSYYDQENLISSEYIDSLFEYERNGVISNLNSYKFSGDIPEFLILKNENDRLNRHIKKLYFKEDYVKSLFKAIEEENLSAIERFFIYFQTEYVFNDAGEDPLVFAIKKRKNNVVRYLLKRGFDYNLKNKYGRNAIDIAYKYKNFEALKLLKNIN